MTYNLPARGFSFSVEAAHGKFTEKMEILKRRINAIDASIDPIIFQLYGLAGEGYTHSRSGIEIRLTNL